MAGENYVKMLVACAGVRVRLIGKAPAKLWRGWRHEHDVFEERGGKEPRYLGAVVETSLRKFGGATIDRWIVVEDGRLGREIMDATVNDLVDRTRECEACGDRGGSADVTRVLMDDMSAVGKPNVTALFCGECRAFWTSPEGRRKIATEQARTAERAAGWPDVGDDDENEEAGR